MNRPRRLLRFTLPALAFLAVLAVAAATAAADPLVTVPVVPAVAAVPAIAANAALEGGRCSEAEATPPAAVELFPPPPDFILCSCKFCRENPQVECQISPDGYSILCYDWARLHC